MSRDDKMAMDDRRKYLDRMRRRYEVADRAGKAALLDEMEAYTGLHRKSLVRLMRQPLVRKARAKQRGRSYGRDVDRALCLIAESHDDICAERLQPNLVPMALALARHGELLVSAELLDQLGRISVSTVRRHLSASRQSDVRVRPARAAPKPNPVLRQVPMGRIPYDISVPGHFEVDLVHHCGSSSAGLYISTLQMIDVATGWTERAAVLGRSYLVMADAFEFLLRRIPFPVLEIHPDNDSAFFNHHLLRFWGLRLQGARLTRSRPYHKNDNRFVEQGNASLVRAYLGNERFITVAQTWTINHLYDRMWLYHNAIQPVMRLQAKRAIPDPNGRTTRVQRTHDPARTPLERLIATAVLTPELQAWWQAEYAATNPRALHADIYNRLDYLMSLPCASSERSQDARLTLRCQPESQPTEYQTLVARCGASAPSDTL